MAAYQRPPTVSDDYRAVDIYRRAATIIYDRGFNATSMGDIADAVDLTKGGLYYYIKGKKALLFAIMNFAIDQLEQEVLVQVREEPDPERRLALMVAGHVRVVLRDRSAMSILVYEEENLTAEHAAKILERKEEYVSILRDSIRQVLERSGNPGQLDPHVISSSLLGMIHWVVRWYQPGSGLAQDQVVRQLTHLVLHGILSPFPVS